MTEAYICDFVRTPIGRYEGSLARVRTDDLAAAPLRALASRHPGIAEVIDEVYLGCANQAGEDNRNVARMATLLAGFPKSVPGVTVNRLCSSGLDAVAAAARAIRASEIDVALAGGVESMTRAPLVMGKAGRAFQRNMDFFDTTIGWRFVNAQLKALYGVDSMPETGENVAHDYNVSRGDQDAFAVRSQQRAARAANDGIFAAQIVPVVLPSEKNETQQLFGRDEQLRPDTSLEILARLKPVVRADGTVTAGNASPINDGAAALLIASDKAVGLHGLKPLARVLGFASAGVAPRVMGIGPIDAVNKLLARLQMKIAQFDVIELNEAFASQALASLRALGLPDDAEHVNPNGGAIALGHPLGMSGARIAGAVVKELVRTQGRYGLATMCVGVGQGAALAVERL
jgi:3-oxoadipyl-CoA thiolase